MSVVRLGDVCQQARECVKPGERPELRYIGLETIESGSGMFVQGELSKTPDTPMANSFRFGSEHVLYGKLRPYLNKVALPDFEGKCSTEIIPLLPSADIERAYLGYFLRSGHVVELISARTAGARMPRADMDFVFSLPIPLPPLPEQRCIVDLLSRAEGIVRLRRKAEKKAAELIPALFLDMFGDPATNPKGWSVRKVSEFVSRFEGGKNLQAGSENGSPYRILKVSAATSGQYLESESKPTPDGYVPPPNHIVRVGDMLFSRANTEELVGATAIVDRTNSKTLLPDKLWRMVWAEPAEPLYMHALFQSPHVRQKLGKLSSGTSASMRNISQGKLFDLALPIAPYEWQKKFVERASSARSIVAQQSVATTKAQAAFDTLLANIFQERGAS